MIAASITALSIALMAQTGLDILKIYLQTSYFFYPLALLLAPAVLAALAVTMAGAGLHELMHNRFFSPPTPVRAMVLLLSAACFTAALTGLREFHLRRHGKEPSAKERFWARVGPAARFGPFTAHRAASGSMVIWYFDPFRATAPAGLRYGREPKPDSMSAAKEVPGSDGRRHEFHLSGLVPATRYYYTVPAWGDKVYSFISPPEAGSLGPVRFICLGDTGNTREEGFAPSYYGPVMRAAEQYYREQGQGPAFMIHAGDIVRTGTDLDSWLRHFTSFDSSSLPVMMTAGNHELLEDYGSNYRYFFGQPLYYSFDYGAVHFLSLNAFDGPGAGFDGPVLCSGAEQYDFAKRDLAATRGARWIVVIMHIPMLSTGDYGNNEILLRQYRELFKANRVDLVIAGHDHNFDSFLVDPGSPWGGTIYLVAGTGGSAVDSYIMDSKKRAWKTWYHDRSSEHGLYQHDELTKRYHVYGELSWGFTDVMVKDDTLTVSYCRWLDLPGFLEKTGQERKEWDMIYLDERTLSENGLTRAVTVKSIAKKRKFD